MAEDFCRWRRNHRNNSTSLTIEDSIIATSNGSQVGDGGCWRSYTVFGSTAIISVSSMISAIHVGGGYRQVEY